MKLPEASVLSPLQKRAEQDPQFAEDMWRFRVPEKGGEKLTLEAIQAEALPRYGLECKSLDTLSRFYSWLKVRREFQEDREFVEQYKEEMRKDPAIPEEEVQRRGRVAFMLGSMRKRDPKVFAVMHRLGSDTKKDLARDRQMAQRDKDIARLEKVLEQNERKLKILESRAKDADAAAEQLALLKAGGKMMPEDQRKAILDKMDEILGMKK